MVATLVDPTCLVTAQMLWDYDIGVEYMVNPIINRVRMAFTTQIRSHYILEKHYNRFSEQAIDFRVDLPHQPHGLVVTEATISGDRSRYLPRLSACRCRVSPRPSRRRDTLAPQLGGRHGILIIPPFHLVPIACR